MKKSAKKIIMLGMLFGCLSCGLLTLEEADLGQAPISVPETPTISTDRSDSVEVENVEGVEPVPEIATQPPLDLAGADVEIGPIVTPTFFPAVYTDTSKQLETFDAFWQIVADEYVYPDFNGVDWDGIRPEYRSRVKAGMSNPEFWNMLAGLTAMLDDEHSYFVPTDQSEGIRDLIRNGPGYSGVGVSAIGRPERGDVLAAWVIPGNGLHAAGIRSGDSLIAVDGHPLCCNATGEPFEYLLGPEGSMAQVTYQAAGQPIKTVPVTRGRIKVNESMRSEKLANNIGYIQINTFLAQGLVNEFKEHWMALNSSGAVDGLIIDLRTNTGGLVISADLIMTLFVDGTTSYYYKPYAEDGSKVPNTRRGDDLQGSQSVPLAVLVGEATNSRAEVFAGVIHDMGRGTVIGRPTVGNIETISPFDLPDGSLIYLATDSFLPLSGDDWEENGLTIDILVEQPYGRVMADGRDEALETALDLLSR